MTQGRHDLHDASMAGDLEAVKRLLEPCPENINVRGPKNVSFFVQQQMIVVFWYVVILLLIPLLSMLTSWYDDYRKLNLRGML